MPSEVMRSWRTRLAAIAVAASLSACAVWQTPQTDALLNSPPAGMPAQWQLRDVPFVAQTDLQCGPASLSMAMGAVGVNLSLDTLRQEVFLPARGGSLQVEMLAAPRRHGLVSTLLPADMTDLLQEVAAGHPVVVLLNLALDIYPVWHYAVITGYDLPAHEVILHSGKDPDMHMVLATFEHTWSRAGRWAFVALPPDRLPRTATQAEVERAAVAFEQAGDAAHAQVAYHTALQAWPDNLVLQLGWGNTLFALGQTTEAAGVFEAAARQHDSAAAWNNLANARLKLHQREAALRAADKAVERARASEPQMLDAALATQAEVRASAP